MRANARTGPSGSAPRSKRCEASVCIPSARAARRMARGSQYAASRATVRVESPTSLEAPPMIPARASGASGPATTPTGTRSARSRSTPSRVVTRSPARAQRTCKRPPGTRARSNACVGLAHLHHDVVGEVDEVADGPHPDRLEALSHPGRRGPEPHVEDARAEARTQVGGLDHHVERLRRGRAALREAQGERLQGQPVDHGHLARHPVDVHAVHAVRGHVDVEHGVVPRAFESIEGQAHEGEVLSELLGRDAHGPRTRAARRRGPSPRELLQEAEVARRRRGGCRRSRDASWPRARSRDRRRSP